MTSAEIRQKFLDFFKARGHTIVPSSSLVPDDPSVLLTTAGMQQFKPYYSELDPTTIVHPSIGKPIGKNAASCQKSFRTSDIDEVGDESHLTFFEMLGNFSFGGPDAPTNASGVGASYFKKEAIQYAHEFITREMGLKISYVSVFEGKEDINVPKDEESKAIWKSLDPNLDVREEGMPDVFWGPTGSSGPCGPTTEMYCKNGAGQDIEVWNIVFNQYFYSGSREELLMGHGSRVMGHGSWAMGQGNAKKLEPLKTPGVDTGMGLERLAMCVQKTKTIFETDLFAPLIALVSEAIPARTKRILADHARAAAFLLSDDVRPSNKEAGYVLRRLLRRVFAYVHLYNLKPDAPEELMKMIISSYGGFYHELVKRRDGILNEIWAEYERFKKTVNHGLAELKKLEAVDAKVAFSLYESYGLPYEIIKELGGSKADKLNRAEFDAEFKKHQKISRAGQEKKFGGHGLILNTGEVKAGNEEEFKKALRLHTTTHLLQQALREVLGFGVRQMGSDVTAERTRFDFAFPRKVTPEEIKKVESLMNEKIKEDLPVNFVELPKTEAEKVGALYFFKEKYPERVKVYFIGNDIQSAWSKEFCGGPHVAHTGEIGEVKITKEEAVSAGVRRIRATLVG